MTTTGSCKRGNLILLLVFGLFLVLLLAVVLGVRILGGCGVTFYERYKLVQPGMAEDGVVSLLGHPSERSTEFHLGQPKGFEEEYKRAEDSDSAYYLFWNKGIDVVYAVGFDAQSNVTVKAVGGT